MVAIMRGVLAVFTQLLLLGALVIIVQMDVQHAERDILLIVLGAIIANSKDPLGFYFGTSQSSADKTAIIAERPSGRPADPVHVDQDPLLPLDGAEIDNPDRR